MNKRRGRYLKSREEQVVILRTDIDAIPPVAVIGTTKAIITIKSGSYIADGGFAENDRIYAVVLNYVLENIREEDVIIRTEELRSGVDATNYTIQDEPLWVATIEKTRKVTRLECRDKQRG